MRKIVKVLSHKDRVFGRIVSGGRQISKNKEGIILVTEIRNGFFEKKILNNCLIHRQLHLNFSQFNAFRNTPLN